MKKKGKLKVARAFLRLPALDFWSVRYSHWILSIRWICSVMLCLFCSSTCGAPNISVYCYNFWGAAPFVSPDHSFGFPFLSFSVWSWARSPPESAPWLSPRSSGTAIRRFPLLLFLFPCGCDSKISTVVVLIPLWFSCFCSPLWLILIDCPCALVL